MKHYTRHAGKVKVKGSMYNRVVGSRAEVWHGTARKTSGGLMKKDLIKKKSGRLVSKAKHHTATPPHRPQHHHATAPPHCHTATPARHV